MIIRIFTIAYYYQVFAINVVGNVWDYSDPAFNEISPPGGGWPTLTLNSQGSSQTVIAVPTTSKFDQFWDNARLAQKDVTLIRCGTGGGGGGYCAK